MLDLRQELAQKAITWVLADRLYEARSAKCTRLESEIDEARESSAARLHDELKSELICFHEARLRAEEHRAAFHRAARALVECLEKDDPGILTVGPLLGGPLVAT